MLGQQIGAGLGRAYSEFDFAQKAQSAQSTQRAASTEDVRVSALDGIAERLLSAISALSSNNGDLVRLHTRLYGPMPEKAGSNTAAPAGQPVGAVTRLSHILDTLCEAVAENTVATERLQGIA